MKEKWIHWEHNNFLPGKYYFSFLTWPEDGVIIQLINYDQKQKIELFFNLSVDSFRYTNESFCFAIFGELSEKYGDDFYANWSFFKITNSDYLQWMSKKSRGWSNEMKFTHFCILGGDEMIDIITNEEPEIKIINYE